MLLKELLVSVTSQYLTTVWNLLFKPIAQMTSITELDTVFIHYENSLY